jgi:hypothetical protein
MSNILTASGNRINTKILLHRPLIEAYSNMRWPQEQPTKVDMQLWRNAMLSICPSRCKTSSVGHFLSSTHRIWRWSWCKEDSTLCHLNNDRKTEDVFVSGCKPNRFHYSLSQPCSKQQVVCSVLPTLDGGHWRLLSTAPCAAPSPSPSTLLEVLEIWGNTWLWEYMTVTSGMIWVYESIAHGTLVAVTDLSYIWEQFPELCSVAFALECSVGCGRIVGLFSESLIVANAYRGDLLGLMAIHLILLSINKIHRNLAGSVEIESDCLGALNSVTHLPPYRIPSHCCHSDILKNILIHCSDLSFTTYCSHIKAYQDDSKSFDKLSQKAQLNCTCNHAAKQRIAVDGTEGATPGRMFPLEPISVFVKGEKMTSETGVGFVFGCNTS